jgi:hypothetical protein
MSVIPSEYYGRTSGRYSAAASGKYNGFGVVDFKNSRVGDNYEPYPNASGQMTGGSAASLPPAAFVKPAGKIYKFMQPKVTMMPTTVREPVYPVLAQQPKPSKKTRSQKRKSSKRGSSRRTKKSASRR